MKHTRRIAMLVIIVFLFAAFNWSMCRLLTCRLSNNFSGVSRGGMIEVENYLPHNESSDLPIIDTGFRLTADLPVLDGATALMPVYAAIIHNTYPKGSVQYTDGTFSADSAMQYNNTRGGYQAIVDGDTDIFFGATPSQQQRQYAKDMGVELIYVPVGLEAFVFFVNAQNPVDSLSSEDIRRIYAGEYTNWSEVGGANRIINPVTRVPGSGSQTAFESFMGDTPIGGKSPFVVTGASIGFSFRYYLDGIVENDNVKMLALDGVYPNADSIRTGEYPLTSSFYAVYRADNHNPNIPALIEWLLSSEGQQLIEECGYVRIAE